MSTDEEAQNAIDSFHEYQFGGRGLTVNEAKAQVLARSEEFPVTVVAYHGGVISERAGA